MADYQTIPAEPGGRAFADWLVQSYAKNPIRARQGRLAAIVILISEAVALIALLAGVARSFQRPYPAALTNYLVACSGAVVLLLIAYLLNRRGLTHLAGIGLALVLLGTDLGLLLTWGPQTPSAVALILPVIVAGLFGPPLSAAAVALLAGVAYLALNLQADPRYLELFFAGGRALQTGLVYLNLLLAGIISWLFSRTTEQAIEESTTLSLALVTQRETLEARLEVQTRQLQATTTVARAVAGARDLNQLLEDIVQLVRETFDYYHVQVFLVDEGSEYAVLQQSTGEAGQALLSAGHRLPVGSLSVIGQVTARGRPVIARDTDMDAVHRRNELLPLTRSELAVPLIVGDQIIGALDLQSVEADAFGEETFPTFQAMADQLAIAIENARLFEQAEANLREFRQLSQDAAHRSWRDFLAEAGEEERRQIYGPEPKGLQLHRSRVVERVLSSGSVIVSTGKDGRQAFLAAPIVVRNEVVGVLGVEPSEAREWTQEDLRLVQGIAERTSLAVENARLYLQARRAAERERLINTIASRLQRAPSLSMLLESATKELSEALGTSNVYAEISLERPLAQQRKDVAEPDEAEVIEADAHESKDLSPADEPEEAKVEK